MKYICSECGSEAKPGERFCGYCGGRVIIEGQFIRCEKCGAAMDTEAPFCPECGAPVKKRNPYSREIKAVIISASVIVIVTIIAFLALMLSYNKKEDDLKNLPTPAVRVTETPVPTTTPTPVPEPTREPAASSVNNYATAAPVYPQQPAAVPAQTPLPQPETAESGNGEGAAQIISYERARSIAMAEVNDPDILLSENRELTIHNGRPAYYFVMRSKSMMESGGSGTLGMTVYVYADTGETDMVVEAPH